jgi:DnaK suppressor protein
MRSTERAAVRKKLLEQVKKLEAARPRDVAGSDDKLDEDAAPLEEMNQVIASSRNKNDQLMLAKVRAAIHRLDKDPDDFGNCTDCGDEIALKRLQAMPWVELCVDCQGKADKQKTHTRKSLTDYVDE